jgi:2,3-dihydro-2,3-dihydroxybenzoate dehydrogenase
MERKVAVVTGAAGGIGSSVVRALCEHDVVVAAVDSNAGRLAETAEKIAAGGQRVVAFPADVSIWAQPEAVVAAVEDRLGPVEYLVNSVGVLRLGKVTDLSSEDWMTSFMANATSVFLMSQAVVKRMVPRSRGALVTVTSNAANTPRTEMAAYSASKAAATMFTKCLGLEVARYGIRCNLVAPGSTDTPMLESMWRDESGRNATIDGRPEAYRVGIPLRRLARPQDIANAVVFLLDDRASHITMHSLTVDGGACLGV